VVYSGFIFDYFYDQICLAFMFMQMYGNFISRIRCICFRIWRINVFIHVECLRWASSQRSLPPLGSHPQHFAYNALIILVCQINIDNQIMHEGKLVSWVSAGFWFISQLICRTFECNVLRLVTAKSPFVCHLIIFIYFMRIGKVSSETIVVSRGNFAVK